MKRMGVRGKKGFALPTVMIASVVMLIVLLSGLVAASSTNTAIRDQHRLKALQMAMDAGVAMVDACLARSYNTVTWTGKILRPNTDCNGDTIAGSAYVMDTPTLKTTFEVPELTIENGTQRANVTGKVLTYRSSGSILLDESSSVRSALAGSQTGFSNVTFGYCANCGAGDGAQLAVILATGEVKVLGQNDNGRLGTGNFNVTTTPGTFLLPVNERGVAAFSNFLSIGRQLSVLTASGKVYSAGSNEHGQLGNPALGTASPRNTPVQFGSLGNSSQPRGTYVAMSNYATYVMASDNNIYSAGNCVNGLLGWGCSSGTSATSARVALPTPTSDLNTQPQNISTSSASADNMVVDRLNAYVRMKGGAVYGWGINDFGQLGTGNTTQANTPVRLQANSTTGAPYINATQLAFNGTAIYALDATGQVWAAGSNGQGELLGAGVPIRNNSTNKCMRVDPATYYLMEANCNGGDGWQFLEIWPDGKIRFRTNSGTSGPTDPMLCAHDSGMGAVLHMGSCGAYGAAEIFTYNQAGNIVGSSGGCVDMYGATVYMSTCGKPINVWYPLNSVFMRTVPRPPYDSALGRHPRYTRIATDNRVVILLDENGVAWAAGGNNRGQQGTASPRGTFEPMLKRVIVPAGLKVKDIYTTETDPGNMSDGNNYAAYNNSYYVLDDGSVYGAGANNFGQLGNAVPVGTNFVGTPVKMNLPAGVIARSVQSGFGTTVILTNTGKIYTVGNNSNGQLGDGTTDSKSVPAANAYTNQRSTIVY